MVEAGRGDHRPTGVAHGSQHTGIRPGIEGVRGALAVTAPQPLELGVGQVEAVHRHVGHPSGQPRPGRGAGEHVDDEGGLAGAGRAGDTDHDAAGVLPAQGLEAVEKSVDVRGHVRPRARGRSRRCG